MTTLKLRVPSPTPLTAADHDENMLRLFGFPTLAAMLADEDRDYTFYAAGATVITLAEGYRYEVAASDATDHHLITAADLKLYVLPGDDSAYNLGAFNPVGDDATDDHAVFKRAFHVARDNVLHLKPGSYFLSESLENTHQIHVLGHGAKLRFPPGVTGIFNKSFYSWGAKGVHLRNQTPENFLAHKASLVKYGGNIYHPNNADVTQSLAGLAANRPDISPTVWKFLRAQEGRDATVPAWSTAPSGGSANLPMYYQPSHASYYTFRPGTYVTLETNGTSYLVAPADATDHDHLTMFDVKLYDLDPEDWPPISAADGSIFENFTLDGTDVSGDPADGFRMRTAAVLRNLTIENFSGHGVNTDAQVPQQSRFNGERWGNTNRFTAIDCTLRYNGDCGWFSRGSDSNAGLAYGLKAYGNGRIGIMDQSFLGNTFFGCRTWSNGNGMAAGNTGGRSSVVSHGGDIYQAKFAGEELGSEVPNSQLDLYVETEPGSDEAVWMLIGEGEPSDEFPAWQSGQDSGFYFHGGGFRSTSGNALTSWFGCSSGEDEGGGVWGARATNIGGYQPYTNIGGQVSGENGGVLVVPSLYVKKSNVEAWVPHPNHIGNIFAFSLGGGSGDVWGLRWNSFNGNAEFLYANSVVAYSITGEDTTLTFGTTTPKPYLFVADRGIIIGAGNNGRRHDTLTAAPTTGEWARGDVIYNRAPSADGNVGWICVAAGTPGTWKAFGSIAS